MNDDDAMFAEVWKILLDSYTEYGAFIWMTSGNSHLYGFWPVTLINQGHGALVLEAARAIEGGS